MENRVYKFGCRSPREPALAEQLLGQAWLYQDALRRIYNDHKRETRAVFAALADNAHVLAYERYCAATEEIGHVFVFERKTMWRNHQDALNAGIRSARAARVRGHLLDWGTYTLIEEAAHQANDASGRDPIKKARWKGTGRIGAMIKSSTKFLAAAWKHPRVHLTAPDERGHALLTIRIGEAKKKSPIRSITWPIKLHRPMPPGAVVQQVAVQRTRDGHRYRWEALITLAFDAAKKDDGALSVVGVDIGWRRETEGMARVATHAAGADVGALLTDTLAAFEYADEVRGTRDRLFDQAKVYVKERRLLGWEHCHLWKAKDRMRRLARQVDDLGVAWYIERDKHLEDIESAARRRAMRRRLDAFRTYADRLAKRYRIVALEDMWMSDWVGEAVTHAKERKRSSAGLALLQNALVERFGSGRVCWVPAQYTSMTCSDCGEVRAEPVGPVTHWSCVGCGSVHHQDENAAEIIRQRCERWIADGHPLRARTPKPKKGKGRKDADAIATGDDIRMTVTAREPLSHAAE